jgi:hypothetical protein
MRNRAAPQPELGTAASPSSRPSLFAPWSSRTSSELRSKFAGARTATSPSEVGIRISATVLGGRETCSEKLPAETQASVRPRVWQLAVCGQTFKRPRNRDCAPDCLVRGFDVAQTCMQHKTLGDRAEAKPSRAHQPRVSGQSEFGQTQPRRSVVVCLLQQSQPITTDVKKKARITCQRGNKPLRHGAKHRVVVGIGVVAPEPAIPPATATRICADLSKRKKPQSGRAITSSPRWCWCSCCSAACSQMKGSRSASCARQSDREARGIRTKVNAANISELRTSWHRRGRCGRDRTAPSASTSCQTCRP